nr:mrna degradation protein, mitochondrial [Quercus suber]
MSSVLEFDYSIWSAERRDRARAAASMHARSREHWTEAARAICLQRHIPNECDLIDPRPRARASLAPRPKPRFMFRPLVQYPSWSNCTYVCHHCRRSVAATKRSSRRHRTASTSTFVDRPIANDGEEETHDDWTESFKSARDTTRSYKRERTAIRSFTRSSGSDEAHEVDQAPRDAALQRKRPHVLQRSLDIDHQSDTMRTRPVKAPQHDKTNSELLPLSIASVLECSAEEDEVPGNRQPNPFASPKSHNIQRGRNSKQMASPETHEAEWIKKKAYSKSESDTTFLDSLATPSPRLQPSRRSPFGLYKSSHPLLSKAQQTNERAAWGDATGLPSRVGGGAASYDTLRNADRLSTPDPINPRQSDLKIWGSKLLADAFKSRSKIANAFGFSQWNLDPDIEPATGSQTIPDKSEKQADISRSPDSDVQPQRLPITETHADAEIIADVTKQVSRASPEKLHSATSKPKLRIMRRRARVPESRQPHVMLADASSDESHDDLGAKTDRTAADLPKDEMAVATSKMTNMPGTQKLADAPSDENHDDLGAKTDRTDADLLKNEMAVDTSKRTNMPGTQNYVKNDDYSAQSVMTDVESIQLESPSTGQLTPTVDEGDIQQIHAHDLHISPLDIAQPPIPQLAYGLDRVLFNPGVYELQDPHSRVYNFDSYLQKIMPVADFDFNALKEYKTSSQDTMLLNLASEHKKRYIGSTSSMTSTLSHFHFLLSNFRELNLSMMSKAFPDNTPSLTKLNRAPTAMFLRWRNGTYAIDADKEFDSGNVLMMLGKSMELLLTRSQADYERYRKSDSREVSKEDREGPEAYQYTTMGDFLMRSQLDAYDPRLPGTGTFDLKTRAVVSVRMDTEDYVPMTGYEIYTAQGRWNSYEREYYDMIRSTMLKYSLQARMGRMDGIFVAYHNVARIFGFQYIPISQMDRALHGQIDPCLGDQEFRLSIDLYNKVLNMATEKFPNTSLRVFFETRPGRAERPATMTIFAEPMEEPEIEQIQLSGKKRIAEFEKTMMGKEEKPREPVATRHADETPRDADATPRDAASTFYTHTETAADSSFMGHIESASAATHRPLFCATIILYSYTKLKSEPEAAWQYCEGNRPLGLTAEHDWRVEYILKEPSANMSESTLWAMYEDMKHRRKEAYWKKKEDDEEESDGRGSGKKEGTDYYKDMLRGMSVKDAQVRKKLDLLEQGNEKIVLGVPGSGSPNSSRNTTQELAKQEDKFVTRESALSNANDIVGTVEEYMQLLYDGQQTH